MGNDLFAPAPLTRQSFESTRLSIVPVNGDHMLPTLRGGFDYVLAAPTDRFLYDSLYVVEDQWNTPLIYRVQSNGHDGVSLIRDNPAYGDTPAARCDRVTREWFAEHVLGIVVCDLKVRDADLLRQNA